MGIPRHNVERLKLLEIIVPTTSLKENDLQLFTKLKNSIEQRGQLHNIIVCETELGYECLAGSKIVRAMRELGCDDILGVNLGILSDEEKLHVKIEISRDYFLTDYVMIGEMLKEITKNKSVQQICNTLPFDVRQANKMINMTEFDWDDFNQTKQLEGQISMFDILEREEQNEDTEEQNEDTFLKEMKEIEMPEKQQEVHFDFEIQDVLQQNDTIDDQEVEITFDIPQQEEKPTHVAHIEDHPVQQQTVVNVEKTAHKEINLSKTIDPITFDEPEKQTEQLSEIELLERELAQDVKEGILDNDTKDEVVETVKKIETNDNPTSDTAAKEDNFVFPDDLDKLGEEKKYENEAFLIDERNILVIKSKINELQKLLPSIGVMIVKEKFNQFGNSPDMVYVNEKTENSQLHVSHVILNNPYGVKYNLKLTDVYDYLLRAYKDMTATDIDPNQQSLF